jgi:serine/threonine-protein kinase
METDAQAAFLAVLADELRDTPYAPLKHLGSGAQGAAYEVEHRTLRRRLVMKLLRDPNRPDLEDRLRLEAQSMAQLSHPNVVQVVDYARSPRGRHFIVTERLQGRTLKEVVGASGALPVRDAVLFVSQALAGLYAAHRVGVVHRDVKLDNLFLTDGDEITQPRVVVLDFGIAKLALDRDGQSPNIAPLETPTAEGVMVGTPSFMAPEQVLNLKVDHRADIYGAGVVLYRLLAGRPPFLCKDLIEYASAHASEIPTPPSRFVDLPPGLEAVVLRALEKRPENRFASAKEMIDALAPFLSVGSASAHASPPAPERSPESLPTNPLPGKSVLANPAPVAQASPPNGVAARGTEMMMQAPPAPRGTEMMMQSPPRGTEMLNVALQSPPRGTEMMMQSPPRGTEVVLQPAAFTPQPTIGGPQPLLAAPPVLASRPLAPHEATQLSRPATRSARPIEIAALVVAALAVLVIAYLCAKLLGLIA